MDTGPQHTLCYHSIMQVKTGCWRYVLMV